MFALAFSLCPVVVFAWPAAVLHIHDGNTLAVAPGGDTSTPVYVCLYGIDAPELQQEGGTAARDALVAHLPSKAQVEIVPMGIDTYGRTVGLVVRDGRVLNALMVKEGHAWVYAAQCRAALCQDWQKAQRTAKDAKLGLWQAETPVPPWQWRQRNPDRREEAFP